MGTTIVKHNLAAQFVLGGSVSMRVAAIDLGTVRVGLAVSDELGFIAHPRPYIDARNRNSVLRALVELTQNEQIRLFLVGLPRLLNGREGARALSAKRFAEVLRERARVSVELVDEWLSTREATARLREQGVDSKTARLRVDSAAAAVLLQSWLDARRLPEP